MADITYTPKAISFNPYVDGETIVSAGGGDGFNARFDSIASEFVQISTVFGNVNTAIKNVQQLQFLVSQPTVTIAANSSTTEFEVETYDRTPLPANIDKTYFCVILPVTGSNIVHTFLYHQIPGNKMHVTIAFYNPTGAQVSFGYRILSLAEQSS
jgi:hypothetical protein